MTAEPHDPDRAPSKGEQTRQAVLDAAILRFGRDGFRATSVADINREAGAGNTAAFAYFKNKERLFLAAADEDVSAVLHETMAAVLDQLDVDQWRQHIVFDLAAALERHPLAKRLLGGLEPEATTRVMQLPALVELRSVCADLLRRDQREGRARADIDPVTIANALVALTLSMAMTMVQLGPDSMVYSDDIATLFRAAIEPVPKQGGAAGKRRRAKPTSTR
jgi:AcrR family transcriptional regulator